MGRARRGGKTHLQVIDHGSNLVSECCSFDAECLLLQTGAADQLGVVLNVARGLESVTVEDETVDGQRRTLSAAPLGREDLNETHLCSTPPSRARYIEYLRRKTASAAGETTKPCRGLCRVARPASKT